MATEQLNLSALDVNSGVTWSNDSNAFVEDENYASTGAAEFASGDYCGGNYANITQTPTALDDFKIRFFDINSDHINDTFLLQIYNPDTTAWETLETFNSGNLLPTALATKDYTSAMQTKYGAAADKSAFLNGLQVRVYQSAQSGGPDRPEIGLAWSNFTYTYTPAPLSVNVADSNPNVADAVTMRLDLLKADVADANPNVTDAVTARINLLKPDVADSVALTDTAAISVSPLSVNVADAIGLSDAPWPWIPVADRYDIDNPVSETQTGAGFRFQRKIVRTSNGDLHAVYIKSADVYYAKSTDDGQTWGTVTQLASESSKTPCIAVDSQDNLHVAWAGRYSGMNEDQIRYRKWSGASWDVIDELTSDTDNQQGWGPAIAVDSNDYVHIVWTAITDLTFFYSNIRYIKYTGSWQPAEYLSSGDNFNRYPSMAVGPNDYVHVAYRSVESGDTYTRVRYRRYTSSWQAAEAVTPDTVSCWDPCMAMDDSGNVHMSYTKAAVIFVDGDIKYRQRTSSWQAEVDITTDGVDNSYNQRDSGIAMDADGYIHVAWEGETANSTHWQNRYRLNNGSWQAILNLTNHPDAQNVPNLLWAYWPSNKCNRASTGYAIFFQDSEDTTLKYFRPFNLAWGVIVDVADSVGVTDAVTVTLPLIVDVADSVGLTDSVTVEVTAPAGALTVNVADSIAVAEAVTMRLDLLKIDIADAVLLTDAITARLPLLKASLADALTVTDATTPRLDLLKVDAADTVTVTDTAQMSLSPLKVSVGEAVGVSDGLTVRTTPLKFSVADTLGLSDSLTAAVVSQALAVGVADAIALTDSAAAAIAIYPMLQAFLSVKATESLIVAQATPTVLLNEDTTSTLSAEETGSVLGIR